jgi:hypothetical protein
MNAGRADSLVGLVYGTLLLVAGVVMVAATGKTGVAFGLGVLLSFGIHLVWRLARFDPSWMTGRLDDDTR